MKHPNSINRGSQLRADIKKCEDLATQKAAAFELELSSIQAEIVKAKAMAQKAKANLAAGTPQNIDTGAIKGKRAFLEMKLTKVEEARDAALAARDQLSALRREELDTVQRDAYQRMRGLLAYSFSTGQTSPDCQLLYDTLTDFLEAKSDGDRKAAHRSVDLIFEHGDLGDSPRGETTPDDRILAELESIRDPEQATAFYNKHRDQIHAAYESRRINP